MLPSLFSEGVKRADTICMFMEIPNIHFKFPPYFKDSDVRLLTCILTYFVLGFPDI
jgi:hypothetical protein